MQNVVVQRRLETQIGSEKTVIKEWIKINGYRMYERFLFKYKGSAWQVNTLSHIYLNYKMLWFFYSERNIDLQEIKAAIRQMWEIWNEDERQGNVRDSIVWDNMEIGI